jgi:endo-1,3-1,4-beta-glycanase ExoK
MRIHIAPVTLLVALGTVSVSTAARATSSGELYTAESYSYGRFEARVQFAGGDGVVGSFFLWKDGSELEDAFWNELDLETVWADCELFTNALYGNPEAGHSESAGTAGAFCTGFHTYAYEWTPDYIAWFVDGTEIRRETEADSIAFRDNAATDGMAVHFNVWPGDSTFGGNFSEAILPLHEYVNWVQYSSYADGQFTLEWREDFAGSSLPEGWQTGNWDSPKGLSTHAAANVSFLDGYAVISLTTDAATGPTGAAPVDLEGGGPVDPGSGGSVGTGGSDGAGGSTPTSGGGAPASGAGGVPSSAGGAGGTGVVSPTGGAPSSGAGGSGAAPSGTGGGTSGPTGPSAAGGGCAVGGPSTPVTSWAGLILALGAAGWLRRREQRQ